MSASSKEWREYAKKTKVKRLCDDLGMKNKILNSYVEQMDDYRKEISILKKKLREKESELGLLKREYYKQSNI
ncbi:MAG: hypothetical protein LLG05_14475, partial [Porphyromonadaceae bacterium]|nr:hypothetical protein [Porphyromonadaceae bacterium]